MQKALVRDDNPGKKFFVDLAKAVDLLELLATDVASSLQNIPG